jgi:hypothetical protein
MQVTFVIKTKGKKTISYSYDKTQGRVAKLAPARYPMDEDAGLCGWL